MSICDLTLVEARTKLRNKELSCTELMSETLQAIQNIDPTIQSYLTVTAESALQQAKVCDEKGEFDSHPLYGIPLSVKDLICTEGVKTTAASKILENFVPPYSATTFLKMEQAGGIMTGKVNLDEFAMGSSCENSAFFPTKNPWDVSRIPGGSSGGSAASVAARLCLGSLGTDTGGSIRQPAAMCGVVGIKPTYGRVSRYGVMPMASSLDQVGPFAKTVEDAAVILESIAGRDPLDATTSMAEVPSYSKNLDGNLQGIRIGIPREYFEDGLDEEDAAVLQKAIDFYRQNGAEVIDVSLPNTKYALAVYYVVMFSEVSSNLARYDGVRFGHTAANPQVLDEIYVQSKSEGFGPEPKRRIILGTFTLSAGYADKYYHKAQTGQRLIREDFDRVFEQVDVLLTPTSPTTAWKLGEKVDDPVKMYLSDIYTIPANLAGICGLSMPVGFSRNMPVGMQVLGKHFSEQMILNVAHALDRELQFYKNAPEISSK